MPKVFVALIIRAPFVTARSATPTLKLQNHGYKNYKLQVFIDRKLTAQRPRQQIRSAGSILFL